MAPRSVLTLCFATWIVANTTPTAEANSFFDRMKHMFEDAEEAVARRFQSLFDNETGFLRGAGITLREVFDHSLDPFGGFDVETETNTQTNINDPPAATNEDHYEDAALQNSYVPDGGNLNAQMPDAEPDAEPRGEIRRWENGAFEEGGYGERKPEDFRRTREHGNYGVGANAVYNAGNGFEFNSLVEAAGFGSGGFGSAGFGPGDFGARGNFGPEPAVYGESEPRGGFHQFARSMSDADGSMWDADGFLAGEYHAEGFSADGIEENHSPVFLEGWGA